MPKGYVPAVFVSSTCFDLSQVRVDLKNFIESLGLDPILSEFNSFPVNPNYDAIQNCIENVKQRADIMILIIGGRYGSQTDDGKSVTNLEYMEAKAKGIPVYIFVDKAILNILPVWKNNPNGDYKGIVDTPKLFEFVESLRDKAENWAFGFQTAQDISETLRRQIAYLLMEGLDLRKQLNQSALDKGLLNLTPKALEIIIQKPRGWEYSLFSQVFRDEIHALKYLRYDLKYGVAFGNSTNIKTLENLANWMSSKSTEMLNIIESLTNLINKGLPEAYRESGVPGDAEEIVYIARRITEGYKKVLEWTMEFKKVHVKEDFERLLLLGSRMSTNIIKEIEEFSKRCYKETRDALSNLDKYTEPQILTLQLTLTMPDMTEYYIELNKLKTKYFG